MKTNKHIQRPAGASLAAVLSASLCLACATPALAAVAVDAAGHTSVPKTDPVASKVSSQKCLGDIHAFNEKMHKDGYWSREEGSGYGFPMYGYGYQQPLGVMPATESATPGSNSYWRARPGYEVRTLIASAHILALNGQEQACETLLSATGVVYQGYVADLRQGDLPKSDSAQRRQQEIAAAQPVLGSASAFRSDDLIGTEVVNPQSEDLGSVDDIVMAPDTGKIAYLVIGHGGLFGVDEKYAPVPWADFKATPGNGLLVLDTAKARMAAAPQVKEARFSKSSDFSDQSQKIDAFWRSALTP